MTVFKGFIAIVASLIILITGNVMPAYAGSIPSNMQPERVQSMIEHKGSYDSYYFNESFNTYEKKDELTGEFNKGLARGLGAGVGVAVGATATCYVLDGIAAAFFPPAALLAPTCGYVGGLAGGATAFSLAP